MKVGDKYVLHSNSFPWMSKELDEFAIVTVVEVKTNVRDMWTGKCEHTGLRAQAASGVEYFCNWDSFPSDSMSPYWSWISKEPLREWYDLVFVTQLGYHPEKVPEIVAAQDFIKFCPIHRDFYYVRRDEGCWQCYMEREHGKKRRVNPSPWGNWSRNDGAEV